MHRNDAPKRRPQFRGLPNVRRELLLYVEDDNDNWDVAQLRLGKAYDLLRAASDEEACKLLREHRSTIDVILMDIELRGSQLNGIELTHLIRGNPLPDGRALPEFAKGLPLISKPVIFVTARGAHYPDTQLMRTGADKIISKPVDFKQLQIALSQLVLERTMA